jgi:IS30 family transposase
MPPKYRRLTIEEREEISRGLATGISPTEIARGLGRAPSSVCREIGRPRWKAEYRAVVASVSAKRRASSRRKGKTKLGGNERLRRFVEAKLLLRWSPAQVAKAVREEYPDDEDMRISHEAIYDHVYVLPRGSLRKELISALRREHKYRRKASRATGTPAETRGKIAGMLSIEERPKAVENRIVPGHWEGDLIVGKGNRSAVGTLVERTTRYTILVPLKAKDAVSVRKAYAREMRKLPKELAKTLTYDQGTEMNGHKRFTADTGIQVYFAHPASPWERGTNENTNGLIRQFFPKGTDFRGVSAREIKRVQRLLNGRPRMTLDWKKPEYAFQKLVALNS